MNELKEAGHEFCQLLEKLMVSVQDELSVTGNYSAEVYEAGSC
ncbi:hypothetical protein BN132_4176 [Cronobacter turicensis 564]|nr:hypothetical protein BN132_4176 [Cronobacter turicensis 564]